MMMEHIRQHDWCQRPTSDKFVDEIDIDNCVIERIIQNKFWDPMISSDEEEPVKHPIDWSSVFTKKKSFDRKQPQFRVFVPGLRRPPPHPKISALTKEDHRQCMKVLCTLNMSVLPSEFLGRPIKADHAAVQKCKEIYDNEQKEYLEWAKNLWVTTNCIRALRPKPLIEMIYDAEFKIKAQRLQFFPKSYSSAAQIPLRADNHKCQIILPHQDLIQVNKSAIPEVLFPKIYEDKVSVLDSCSMPEPCDLHPCKFKLPNESSESMLPLPEINKELAQFTLENGADFIASENALKCLLETDRIWTVPISVCEVISVDGERSNIVVLGSDFALKKDAAPMRTYRAYRHLLTKAFTAKTAESKTFTDRSNRSATSTQSPDVHSKHTSKHYKSETNNSAEQTSRSLNDKSQKAKNVSSDSHKAAQVYNDTLRRINRALDASDDSDDDENRLQICVEDDTEKPEVFQASAENKPKEAVNSTEERRNSVDHDATRPRKILKARPRKSQNQEEPTEIRLYDCACKDSEFAESTPRSFKKWQIKNNTTKEQVNIIIHCSHKLQNDKKNDVILEPIVEYQLDIGGTRQSQHKLHSMALSMMLRDNAELVNVRVDGMTGELVTIDVQNLKEFTCEHGDQSDLIANCICTALNQLAGLLPGEYLLRHEPVHGCNAILYSSKSSLGLVTVSLDWDDNVMSPTEEAKHVQTPPALGPVLLPVHKYRRQLPLAFTYDLRHVAKEPIKLAKKKPPPAAIQWPKKRGRKPKKKTNQTNTIQ